MAIIILTPSPTPTARYYYVARMASGEFKWSSRLGEAVRFTDEESAQTALAGMNGWGWEPLIKAARIMRVAEQD